MLQRCSCRFAMVLENQDVLEAPILLQIDDAIAECPEHVFDAFVRHVGECVSVIRSFDNNFMRADAVHAVVHAVGAAIEVALDSQSGILVRNHADRPARFIALATIAISKDLGRSFALVARTKRAESAFKNYRMSCEIARPACSIGGDNDPASADGVLPKLGQLWSFPCGLLSFYDMVKAFLNRVISVESLESSLLSI